MKRIVLLGPESTGKSTLAAQLAAHYSTVWCPEAAREYLLEHGMEYTFDDLLTIANRQLQLEDRMATGAKDLYFIDTDMYVMKVWCEVAFNNCHTWILKQIATRPCDLYLLCNVDLPWVQDGLREYPDPQKRAQLFMIYYDIVINSGVKWALISGTSAERLERAIAEVENLFGTPQNRVL